MLQWCGLTCSASLEKQEETVGTTAARDEDAKTSEPAVALSLSGRRPLTNGGLPHTIPHWANTHCSTLLNNWVCAVHCSRVVVAAITCSPTFTTGPLSRSQRAVLGGMLFLGYAMAYTLHTHPNQHTHSVCGHSL